MSKNRTVGIIALSLLLLGTTTVEAQRRVVSLDGTWELGEGGLDEMPDAFGAKVPVPGLVDMARPAFVEVGVEAGNKLRRAFWYRRTFAVEGLPPEFVLLKIGKAKYGTKVFVNGEPVGEHLPCFTPVVLNITKWIKHGEANELVVRVGAWRDSVPPSVPNGWDFEKQRYLPGIYDSVELILTDGPYISGLQVVPDIEAKKVRVQAIVVAGPENRQVPLVYRVTEVKGGKEVGTSTSKQFWFTPGEEFVLDGEISLPDARLWSPEDPWLYRLEVSTGHDTCSTRFGMRSFGFDPKTKMPLLNGTPYPMRGTNVCVHRFFEDSQRGDKPWDEAWVRRLHRTFKEMHFNAARYCIGFPPERWYEIADEEGILIQDEFPLWYLGQWPKELTHEQLTVEFTAWMRERWNHPSVVIWDAQNETRTSETGLAIQAVRHLDLSARPWDNGWSAPQDKLDIFEAHPYPFYAPKEAVGGSLFRLSGFFGMPTVPGVAEGIRANSLLNTGNNPVIVNEYGWLWLNRDGSPTSISAANFRTLLGEKATVQDRRELAARYLAAMTEFWRSGRQVAGVMHFCGLGYSRPVGETSDMFVDLDKLTIEPTFKRYVGDSFAPVGVMLDYWEQEMPAGITATIPVVVFNDHVEPREGTVELRVMKGKTPVFQKSQPMRVAPVGRQVIPFKVALPDASGVYDLVAELSGSGLDTVRSRRKMPVLTEEDRQARDGIAQGKAARASSEREVEGGLKLRAIHAFDGNGTTRWVSASPAKASPTGVDPQWLDVDLGAVEPIARVHLYWDAAYAKAYTIEVSNDGKTWVKAHATATGDGQLDVIKFAATIRARWIRINATEPATEYGYSLWEFQVFRP